MAEKDKLTDSKKQDQERRTELAMLTLLIERYPREASEKIEKFVNFQKREVNENVSLNATVI